MCEWPNTTASAPGNRRRSRASRPFAGPASCTSAIATPPASTDATAGSAARTSASSTLPWTATTVRRPRARASTAKAHQIAGVEDQIGRPEPLDARVGQPPAAPRHVGVRDDGDLQGKLPPVPRCSAEHPAPVAQGIERSPPERKVAGSNPAGRASTEPPCRSPGFLPDLAPSISTSIGERGHRPPPAGPAAIGRLPAPAGESGGILILCCAWRRSLRRDARPACRLRGTPAHGCTDARQAARGVT